MKIYINIYKSAKGFYLFVFMYFGAFISELSHIGQLSLFYTNSKFKMWLVENLEIKRSLVGTHKYYTTGANIWIMFMR